MFLFVQNCCSFPALEVTPRVHKNCKSRCISAPLGHGLKYLYYLWLLPFWPSGGLDYGGESVPEQVPALAHVDDVEDDALVQLDVVHREIEPEPKFRVARVRSYEQIVLVFVDQIDPAQVSRLEGSVEAKVAFFGLTAVVGRPHDQPVHVSQTSLSVAIFTI